MNIPRIFGLVALCAVCSLEAANPPNSFVMSTKEPIIVSNTLLAPGRHLWKLMDSQSNRHIVQISDESTHKLEAVLLAVPNYREVITSENQVQFWETPVGYAKAVRSWFLPGANSGQEFPYSRKAVLDMGRLIILPVPAERQLKPAPPATRPIAKTSPSIQPAAQRVAKHAVQTSTKWPEGSWAVITDGSPDASRKSAKPRGGFLDTLKRLPSTATFAPLIGLIGVGFLLVYFLTKRKNGESPVPR